MRYNYKPSFKKTLEKLSPDGKLKVKQSIKQLVIFFASGQQPVGLGLKKLRGEFWEIRIGLKIRIIFQLQNDLIEFIIVATHNSIKNYLKRI